MAEPITDPSVDHTHVFYIPERAKVVTTRRESSAIFVELGFEDGRPLNHHPGQFVQISVFGYGEAPISVCSSPTRPESFDLCVQPMGNVSRAVADLSAGDWVGIRGPYGQGCFPIDQMKNKDVLLIAGGIGIAPLRGLIQFICDNRDDYGRFMVVYGAKTPSDILFREETEQWTENPDLDFFLTVDEPVSPDRYREVIEEYAVDYSTAKYARWNRPEYMTGALARFNNNYEQLTDGAKTAAEDLGLTHPCYRPFMNTIAQVVECVHCLEDARDLIDTLLNAGIRPDREHEKVKDQAGAGVGAVEAPRGILFHEYEYDDEGKCLSANMVIPTAQNLANLEADMRAYVPAIAGQPKEIITHRLEMLVRAYDPCISCSTHVIDLRK